MANAYFDIAQELRGVPNLTLQSKEGFADRLYVEMVSIEAGKTPTPPKTDTYAHFRDGIPAELQPGTYHARCKYLMVVDATRTGGDDHHDNWQVLYRADLLKLATDFPLSVTFPDVLVNDNTTRADENTGTDNSVITWTFTVLNPDSYTQPPLYTTAHPVTTTAKLVSETRQRTGPQAVITRRYSIVPTTELTSVEATSDPSPPDKFVDTITRTTVENVEPTVTDVDSGASVIKSAVVALDSARRKKSTVTVGYSTITALVGSELDPDTGKVFTTTTELVPAGTLGSNVGAGGTYSIVDPLNTVWSIKRTSKTTTLTTRSWPDIINYSFPAVLTNLTLLPITRNRLPVAVIVRPYYLCAPYDGPCNATVTETWTKNQPTAPQIVVMRPTPVIFQGVFFSVNLSPCLHQSLTFTEASGNNNPLYDSFNNSGVIDATNFTRWPGSIIAQFNVNPHRGGYLSRTVVVYAPNN